MKYLNGGGWQEKDEGAIRMPACKVGLAGMYQQSMVSSLLSWREGTLRDTSGWEAGIQFSS